jgi:hypothetical protein
MEPGKTLACMSHYRAHISPCDLPSGACMPHITAHTYHRVILHRVHACHITAHTAHRSSHNITVDHTVPYAFTRPHLIPWRVVEHAELPVDHGIIGQVYRVRYRPFVTKVATVRVPDALKTYGIDWGGTGYIAARHDEFVTAVKATGSPNSAVPVANPILQPLPRKQKVRHLPCTARVLLPTQTPLTVCMHRPGGEGT